MSSPTLGVLSGDALKVPPNDMAGVDLCKVRRDWSWKRGRSEAGVVNNGAARKLGEGRGGRVHASASLYVVRGEGPSNQPAVSMQASDPDPV